MKYKNIKTSCQKPKKCEPESKLVDGVECKNH